MVKKKSKRLNTQIDIGTNKHSYGSIKKYCTEKKTNKQKTFNHKIRKNEYLRNRKKKSTINCIPNNLNNKYNKKENSSLNIQSDITFYEIKPLSPTKLSISVKKFYNNNNFKQYEDNLHLYNKSKVLTKETTAIANNEGSKNLSYGDNTLNNKNYQSSERKKNGSHKPYDLIPQLNKEHNNNKKKSSNKTKSVEVFNKECNVDDEKYLNSFTQIGNETQANEYFVEDYQVTQSTIKDVSISVKRFYKNKILSAANDVDKINKDMPLISDTTFNSKTDFNQSPISSKLNNSHKISLNLKCISDTNNKQQKVTAFFPIRRSSRKTKNIVNEEKQLALEKAIASQNEDGLKITVFPNKGRGIIAARDFTRGEYVVEYAGELVNLEEARKRESIYSKDASTGCYMYYFKFGSIHYCIDATPESSRLGRLVNHSRFGNLGPKVVEILGLPRIVLIAKSDIKKGEELTYDYGDRSKKSLIYHPWLAY